MVSVGLTWIIVVSVVGVFVLIIICVAICLCRRRCARQLIKEALETEANYTGGSISQAKDEKNQSKSSIPSRSPMPNFTAPIVKLRSVVALNVADASDDDEQHQNGATHKDTTTTAAAASNGKQNDKTAKLGSNTIKHRILDLSSDVRTGYDVNPVDASMKSPTLNAQQSETANNAGSFYHTQQDSGALDLEVDYATQIEARSPPQTSYQPSRSFMDANVRPFPTKNDIVDDDDEEDIFDG